LRAFHQGLKDAGFVEGENVAIEYRWAENEIDRISSSRCSAARRRARWWRGLSSG
jgi:putative ABC transport system substrate-binding protein